MAQSTIVYWRDIPTQVIVGAGRKKVKRELANRFMVAVDSCAMKSGADGTDDYLADWRRGEPQPCGDDLEAEADALAAKLEEDYPTSRLKALIEAGGKDNG
ncbi:virulence factor [Coralliovum pocilloporae]|uniref:virulence factor n=1 Tax=Coralliovum pocilloporae TaxID=3066369 RepID=UPI003307B8A5